jgi:hypothetical protein
MVILLSRYHHIKHDHRDAMGDKDTKAKPKRQMLVYLPEETVTAIKIAGVEDRESVSSIIERLVEGWLRRRKAQSERKQKSAHGADAPND